MYFRFLLFFLCCMVFWNGYGQAATARIQAAYLQFTGDSQLNQGISSLYVVDAKDGKVVFDNNSRVGLAPASTQKIITAASAYEILGAGYQFSTSFRVRKSKTSLGWQLIIDGSGDPSFGSWRWATTSASYIIETLINKLQEKGIKEIDEITIDTAGWATERIPDGWIWQDIANYYGAGAGKINWHENQYDLWLQSGSETGKPVIITGTNPALYGFTLRSKVLSGPAGSGDQSYIYFPLTDTIGTIRGTIPINSKKFVVAGSLPVPELQLLNTIRVALQDKGIKTNAIGLGDPDASEAGEVVYLYHSPSLDSLQYWFLKKSINLYGEAFLKTIASHENLEAGTENGLIKIKEFWKRHQVIPTELNMIDGSGLSPANRVTTHAQVTILTYAKQRLWYSLFYNDLPEFNGMKMKSGSINGVRSFCGYQHAKDGHDYIFSFIVNNFNGNASTLIQKMYRVLDVLK